MLTTLFVASMGVLNTSSPPLVHTAEGWVQGSYVAGVEVEVFFGVPFAEPPLGNLRFKPPQRHHNWSNVLPTQEYKNDCIQDMEGYYKDPVWGSEDCLYLNVYAPKGAHTGGKEYPVMVFIPGGGYWWESAGVNDCPQCPVGRGLIELMNDVIVVAVPYRVGALGFLGGETLRARGGDGSTGNWGILDQRAGLEWVQRNIHHFGGDPKQVTLWGQSSGAASVGIHMTSAGSQGLFHKVIMQSGSFPSWTAFNTDASNRGYDWLVLNSGCKEKLDIIECLENLTPAEIIAAQRPPSSAWQPGEPKPADDPNCDPAYCWWHVPCRYGSPYMPQIDGVVMTDYPTNLLDKGQFSQVPVLHGKTRDDGRCFTDETTTLEPMVDEQGLWDWADFTYQNPDGSLLPELKKLYPPSAFAERAKHTQDYSEAYFAGTEMSSDFNEQCPAARASRKIVAWGVPVYEYVFTYDNFYDKPFCDHSADLAYTFYYTPYFRDTPKPEEAETMATVMSQMWVNFAKHSNPNGENLPQWDQFVPARETILEFGVNHELSFRSITNYRKTECEFWDSHWEYFHKCIPQPERSLNSTAKVRNLKRSRPWCKAPANTPISRSRRMSANKTKFEEDLWNKEKEL